MGVAIKGQREGDGNVLDLGCINPNILAVIVHYSFGRCYHWGNLVKGSWDLCIIFTTTCESKILSKEKV